MATRSVVGYKNDAGEFIGTYVHFDGYPENMIPELNRRLKEEGENSLKAWVDKGVAGGGFRSVDHLEPYNDVSSPQNCSVDQEEYGYLILPDRVALVFDTHYEPQPPEEVFIPEENLVDWRRK